MATPVTKTTNEDDFWKVQTGPSTKKARVTAIRKSSEVPSAITVSPYFSNIEYPIWIKIESDGVVVSEDSSSKSTWAKDWNKKFYVREHDGNEYVEFTRHAVLLALFKLIEAQGLEPVENIKDLVGFEFDAVIVGSDKGGFINWAQTLKANGVDVPEVADIAKPKKASTSFDNDEEEEKPGNAETKIDPNDLPF